MRHSSPSVVSLILLLQSCSLAISVTPVASNPPLFAKYSFFTRLSKQFDPPPRCNEPGPGVPAPRATRDIVAPSRTSLETWEFLIVKLTLFEDFCGKGDIWEDIGLRHCSLFFDAWNCLGALRPAEKAVPPAQPAKRSALVFPRPSG